MSPPRTPNQRRPTTAYNAAVDTPLWSVRVSAAAGGAEVFARGERWRIASPVSFDSDDRGLSALECALGALGGDLVTGFLRLAERRRLTIDHAETASAAAVMYGAERVFLNPDCGFGTFSMRPITTPEIAEAKLAAIVRAARSLRRHIQA